MYIFILVTDRERFSSDKADSLEAFAKGKDCEIISKALTFDKPILGFAFLRHCKLGIEFGVYWMAA
jgi:hypothetical protein